MTDPRYPVGQVRAPPESGCCHAGRLDRRDRQPRPAALRAAVAGLDDAQLDTPYRAGGWTAAPGGAPRARTAT